MKESVERTVKLGFRASPRKVFDEIETISAEMVRQGWSLRDTLVEDGLGCIHLFFEREVRETLHNKE
jgi:hypothetical protein